MKGGHAAEPARRSCVRLAPAEVELERRPFAMKVGMIWVARFKFGPYVRSATRPDAVTRMNGMVERLALARDSFAAEILSYLMKALIDPDGHWPADPERPYRPMQRPT